jgi:hypothetical protein
MQGNVGLYPKLKKSKYGRFKEAWHLLRGGEETVGDIEACAAEPGLALSTQHSALSI